jgi:propionyl-CoA carboxylase alpha chain
MAGVPAGFRNNRSQPECAAFECGGRTVVVEYSHLRSGTVVAVDGEPLDGFEVHEIGDGFVDVTVDEIRRTVYVEFGPGIAYVDSPLGSDDLVVVPRYPEAGRAEAEGALTAPMPGVVVRVHVEPGDKVAPDDPLVVLEAMKMEHTVRAAEAGIVAELRVAVGDQVAGGDVVVVVAEPSPDDSDGGTHLEAVG